MRKEYITFIKKLLLFAVILVAVDFVIGKCLDSFREYSFERNPHYVGLKTPYMVEKANEDVLIVGASEASHHYIPQMIADSIGLSVYNCGQDGSFFLYQNCLINLTLKRYTPGIIIWQFNPQFLTTSLDEEYEYQYISTLYPYYSDEYCREIIDEKSTFQRVQMLSSTYRHNSKLWSYIIPLFKSQAFDNGYVPIENTGYKYPSMSTKIDNNPINPDKVTRLIETIDYCKEKNVQLVLSVAPSYYDAAVYATPQYQKLVTIASEEGLPIIEAKNYFEEFNDSALYKDINHMNDKGARLWMHYFIPELLSKMNK